MDAMMMMARPDVFSTWVSTAKPTAASAKPPAIVNAGPNRRAIRGTRKEPTTNPSMEGMVASPACSGESPSTSCRYCAMKTYAPNTTNVPSRYRTRAALKARDRKS